MKELKQEINQETQDIPKEQEKATLMEVLGDEAISMIRLQRYMRDQHPTKLEIDDNNQPKEGFFGLFDSLGFLPIGGCCKQDTTDMAKQIGIGPTLFLMSTKALAWFFFFVTLVNIPVFMFFYNGSQSGTSVIDSVFARFSLGNVG